MRKETPIPIRVNPNLKKLSDEAFRKLGMNMHAGINLLLSQMVLYQKIPFEVNLSEPKEGIITKEKTVPLMIKSDEQTKAICTEIARNSGLTLSMVVKMFLVQVVDKQAIPFRILSKATAHHREQIECEYEKESEIK